MSLHCFNTMKLLVLNWCILHWVTSVVGYKQMTVACTSAKPKTPIVRINKNDSLFDVCWTVRRCGNWRIKNRLHATYYFIILLIGWTCFGHFCAHHQELATIMLITMLVILSDVYWTVYHCGNWRMKNQLEVTWYFIIRLIGSTCFGHYYAHHQEFATMMLIATLVVLSDVYWTVHHCGSWRIKNQIHATCYFIVLLIGSTCFGHSCAHHQEFATMMLITTLVVSFCKDGGVSVNVKLCFLVVCVFGVKFFVAWLWLVTC